MSNDKIIVAGIGLLTILFMIGGVFLLSKQSERLSRPLLGQEVAIEGRTHLPDGTSITYNSNPPAGGNHYATPAHAGFYETPPADGYLVHSLEHGAVILWYNPKLLTTDEISKLKEI